MYLRSPMHNMTRLADGATIVAPLDEELHFKGDRARMDSERSFGGNVQRVRRSRQHAPAYLAATGQREPDLGVTGAGNRPEQVR